MNMLEELKNILIALRNELSPEKEAQPVSSCTKNYLLDVLKLFFFDKVYN